MFSPASTSDFFHSLAKKRLPQAAQQGGGMPGAPQGFAGGAPRYTGAYAQNMQQQGPFQGQNWGNSGGGSNGMAAGGFGAGSPWGQFGSYDSAREAKASSGDRYANLTEDPFAKGPGGFLNIQG